jgi:hypothetical protein
MPKEPSMLRVPHLASTLQTVLTTVANDAARTTGFIQRQRQLTGASFVQTLVFGFLANPRITLDQLAQTAAALGTPISAQGLDQRFTPQAAACLQAVLAAAVQHLVRSDPVALPLLRRFTAVYLLDSTTIVLPDALRSIWQGNHTASTTKGTQAALKIQVLWNLSEGCLQHVELQSGRANDNTAAVQHVALPAGALRIADLGYFRLGHLLALKTAGVDVLSRLAPQVAVYDTQGQRIDMVAFLERCATPTVDLRVTVGANERIPMRLIALRMPQEVADQRRRRLRAAHRSKGKTPAARTLALLAWTIVITSVGEERLSVAEALVLLRARWQIELLFKLWKSHGLVDEWRSEQPWRILCEVYAKLLAMMVVHWVVVVSCWSSANRSLVKAAQTVQHHAVVLASALVDSHDAVVKALARIGHSLRSGGRLNSRKAKPNL